MPTAVGSNGQCIAHMATAGTHHTEVRAEMPSGMVPLRELESRSSSLHPGGTCTPEYRWAPYTLRTPLMHQRVVR